jgi:hypothetical protein
MNERIVVIAGNIDCHSGVSQLLRSGVTAMERLINV